MAKITIDEKVCKGCGLCADACPKKVISLSEHHMNTAGYFVAEAVNPQNCIGCVLCDHVSGLCDHGRKVIATA